MGAQIPSIGRIVHYVEGGIHYAAIVVKVWTEECVNLYVLPNGSDPLSVSGVITSVVQSETDKYDRSWHWPEYVG